jgi:putative tricarboxylic transport membrane protein
MRRFYQITGAALLLLAVFVALESLKLKYYTNQGPGPGFFPFWLSLLLGALAIIILLQALRSPEPMPPDFFASRTGYLRMAAVMAALAGTTALLDPLGFRLTMLAMYLFLLYTFGQRRPVVMTLVSLAGSFGVYHMFVRWLKVPLPIGVLGF